MLYIVATPIGNLEDISFRALRILREVDFILCEDTRVTKKLLDYYKVNTKTISYHQHSNQNKEDKILKLLKDEKNLALVTDAGTPGISDPGGKLVEAVIKNFGDKIKIESVPGASAVTTALSISGISADKFLFLGFPPHKKGRQTFLENIFKSNFPVVVYESKHRILKFLKEIQEMNKSNIEKSEKEEIEITYKKEKKQKIKVINSIVVCRELSKMHETVYRGKLDSIIEKIELDKNNQKGEFVVIIN
ncbi:16S rRNA (cytidine(1402)-2'-O)-methyltransferase [Candidatus Parcubacteria bacterium]|nr:16S rRNA (cytidine(1402)-2'-O)-methyltransferase [Candidatus Parcubacteria bacterium]